MQKKNFFLGELGGAKNECKRGCGIAIGVFLMGRFFGHLWSLPVPHSFKRNADNWCMVQTLHSRMSKYGALW